MNMADALEPCPDCGSTKHKSCASGPVRISDIDKPKQILSTVDLLDYGATWGGYEGEKQYRYALREEFYRCRRAEKGLADLLHNLATWGIVEIAARNQQVAEYCKHWEERALAAEAMVKMLRGNSA